MTEHDMWLATPPEDDGPGKTCGTCANCIEECCDFGFCLKKASRDPRDFDDWAEALNEVEACRVDMQVDTCAEWEEYEEGA